MVTRHDATRSGVFNKMNREHVKYAIRCNKNRTPSSFLAKFAGCKCAQAYFEPRTSAPIVACELKVRGRRAHT